MNEREKQKAVLEAVLNLGKARATAFDMIAKETNTGKVNNLSRIQVLIDNATEKLMELLED